MDIVIETLSITVSLVILFTIPAALLTIAYLIKRNGFYITVNCWFCNGWTKVLYSYRNSFYCPVCLQYNGFNKDGGYNRVIEAQFDTSFNKHQKTVEKTASSSNGLCTYCNNNQQLKVRQLASFVPLHEKNYDVEVEHFRAQLEKSYKLCKKCEKVLKTTIHKQHAWIFGNRIKDLQKKGFSFLKSHKSKRFNAKIILINFLRYFLVLLSLVILWQTLEVKVNYPKSIVKKYLPDIFIHYTDVLNGWCHLISNTVENLIRNMCNKLNLCLIPDLKNLTIVRSDILPIKWTGLVLEIFLLIWQPKSPFWKANELLSWIILVITSLNLYPDDYLTYVKSIQVICSATIIYSLMTTSKPSSKTSRKKKFTFKKLNMKINEGNSSDEEIGEETSYHSNFSSFEKYENNKNFEDLNYRSQRFSQNVFYNTANPNNTFTTARSTKSSSLPNTSYKNESNCSSNELHHSLDNLHLSNLNVKPHICASPTFSVNSVNRPILSPPKLKNITQNSWTAGGFWKNDVPAFPASTDIANLSRSSSQSSGFVSSGDNVVPTAYHSLSSSREPSPYGDFERRPLSSEPVYHFTPINSTVQSKHNFSRNTSEFLKPGWPKANQLYYKADNMFYPVMEQNMLIFQANVVPKFNVEGSFSNLSLGSFNTTMNKINSPVLFGEKPVISSLFKNIPGVSTHSHVFKAPSC